MKKVFFALTAVLALSLTGCTSMTGLKDPKAQIIDVKIETLKMDGGVLNLVCEIENPNSVDLQVDHIEYKLSLNKKELTSSEISQPTKLPANQKTLVQIPISFKYADIFSGLGDLLNAKPVSYSVVGKAKMGILTLPFEKTGEIKLSK